MDIRVVMVLFCFSIWTCNGSDGSGTNICLSNQKPLINVCEDNAVTSSSEGVYVNSGNVSLQNSNKCTCIITPDTQNPMALKFNAMVELDSKDVQNFQFQILNKTFNTFASLSRVTTVDIRGATELEYTCTSPKDTNVALCLRIWGTNSKRRFSMSCSKDETQDTDTGINAIAVVVCIVGLGIVAVVVAIVVYRRRKGKFRHINKAVITSNGGDVAVGMQPNPAHEDENHYTEPEEPNIYTSSHYDHTSTTATSNIVRGQRLQQSEDGTYDHTNSCMSNQWTDNEYSHLSVKQAKTKCDNDNYEEFNLK